MINNVILLIVMSTLFVLSNLSSAQDWALPSGWSRCGDNCYRDANGTEYEGCGHRCVIKDGKPHFVSIVKGELRPGFKGGLRPAEAPPQQLPVYELNPVPDGFTRCGPGCYMTADRTRWKACGADCLMRTRTVGNKEYQETYTVLPNGVLKKSAGMIVGDAKPPQKTGNPPQVVNNPPAGAPPAGAPPAKPAQVPTTSCVSFNGPIQPGFTRLSRPVKNSCSVCALVTVKLNNCGLRDSTQDARIDSGGQHDFGFAWDLSCKSTHLTIQSVSPC